MFGKRSYNTGKLLIAAVLAAVVLLTGSEMVSADPKDKDTGIPAEQKTSGTGVAPGIEWAHCGAGINEPSDTWYLAEGCTAPGFETWILLQNPGDEATAVTLTYMTASGEVARPVITMNPMSRATINAADTVPDNAEVSTMVQSDKPIICERAMYSEDRNWAHLSAGVTKPETTWYAAEGCTADGYETWLLIQNPGNESVEIDMELQTDQGTCPGPVDTVPPKSRRSYNLADYVVTYNVSTLVAASGGVVCERATYDTGGDWAHASACVTETAKQWYLAEGCTADGFQTWILVQNPSDRVVDITTELQTEKGPVPGPVDSIQPKSRKSYNLADYVNSYNVSTKISAEMPVVCERAMYSGDRDWAHSSTGKPSATNEWFFAEGCSAFGFQTWLLLQNPSNEPANVEIEYMIDEGKAGGQTVQLARGSRVSINAADVIPDSEGISARITSSELICCERAMYGISRNPMVTPTERTPICPFTRDESIACGHWPAGSLDYPYFGAPRSNGRIHAGVDIYPAAGVGAPVYAIKGGTVIRSEPFYTRYTGEVTYAVLVDHGDFVANYGEVQPPSLKAGDTVQCGQLIGYISGTQQLHLEIYTPGTTNWHSWYGPQPADLIDPTGLMLDLYNMKSGI
ncbi:MAG: M23 family metallopeptidase [Actinobacteria bacterium]|nr:M23 family metallopeptidase [Actinomycetota bacterium]